VGQELRERLVDARAKTSAFERVYGAHVVAVPGRLPKSLPSITP
jgi:hypothetical protein